MSFGMRIWGANGALELDETSFTVRVEYSAIVQSSNGGGRTLYIPLPGVSAATHSAVCIPVQDYGTDAQDYRNIQYIPMVGNDAVVVYFGQPNTNGPIGVLKPQRLIVMRYR